MALGSRILGSCPGADGVCCIPLGSLNEVFDPSEGGTIPGILLGSLREDKEPFGVPSELN